MEKLIPNETKLQLNINGGGGGGGLQESSSHRLISLKDPFVVRSRRLIMLKCIKFSVAYAISKMVPDQ